MTSRTQITNGTTDRSEILVTLGGLRTTDTGVRTTDTGAERTISTDDTTREIVNNPSTSWTLL